MIRVPDFKPSRRLYAVRPDTSALVVSGDLGPTSNGASLYRIKLEAVWFRRKSGETAACIGDLWDFQHERPESVEQFLARHTDGRHGANCRSRWNGHSLWTLEDIEQSTADLALLRLMLDNYSAILPGFDGWWSF